MSWILLITHWVLTEPDQPNYPDDVIAEIAWLRQGNQYYTFGVS